MDHEGSDAGRVVTIMSTDIDAVSGTGEMLHEAWGHGLELVIGMVLLARKPNDDERLKRWLIDAAVCSRVSRYVAQNVRSRTKAWNDATQARNSTLSSILGSMRSIKAMGLSKAISRHVSDLRDREIDSSKHVRRMRCAYNVSGEANALGLFAPVVTVVLFAVVAALRGERLDTNTAFTTIAVLALVTHPANMIMTIVPSVVGSLANIDRIQCFLLERPRDDCRKIRADGDEGVEVNVDDVTVKFKDKTTSNLEKVSLKLPQHSITICAGPTGCGKTTLAKVILGEVSPTQGTVASKHARIGYCDQRAWIPTGTIRDIICAFGETIDEKKYKNVLSICCLDYDLARLSDGDKTVVGSRGVNISGGQRQRLALARLVYSGASIAVLDDTFSALDGTTESQLIENLLGPQGWFRKAKITAFVITNSAQHFHYADQVVLLEHGQIAIQGDWRSLKSHMYEMPEFTLGDGDFANKGPLAWNRQPIATKQASEQASEQDICRSTGDMSLYSYYIRSVGLGNFSLLITGIVLYSLFNTFTTYWFKLWTESDGSSLVFYVVGYVLLAVMAWVATSSTMWCTFMLLAPRSGRQLHESLLKTTVAASLLYFSSTDVGIILNRFSQDISLVDRQLPSSLMALCTQIFKMIAQIVILMQVQRLLLIALPICFILVYLIQGIYLQTSRQLRVLELESHSALYSWFLESTEGILSIRAFDWTKASTKKNFENLEASIRPSYALLTLQCWLALVLNLIVGCISLGVILIATAWRSETSEANVGVSLNLILVANTTLVRLVQSFTELEVSLGAIARLREFETQTAREDKPSENYVPALSWPERGCLKAVNFSAGYQEDHHVLRDVNLHIEQGQKLVICGRTGSGKSTIILGLLRIIESLGTVELDEEALSTIPRQCIRSRAFITVPQEPFFLPDASLGFNLDPTCSASQGMLIEALKSVGIWDVLSHTCHGENVDLLSQPLSSLQALSVGELQLVSMARAIVRKKVLSQGLEYKDAVDADAASPKPILVLDEATSSLDPATEANIYEILEREFVDEGYTALIVAHRISVLGERMRRGQDKVAWVQDGTVVKVGDYEEIAQLVTLPALGDEEEI
ncbi:hypothetical protein QQS21_010769 [Conoideocrella luteorostrata]|uniref:P-loop containing nucleoside triphosphate hydrolase protein n=1 Tax=Conoideocrella luteorostrata TaxID=1105319 RepID=A0AAJ0CEJ7_9HYPO|nr:hypothetical protein QQS21_010769 [Conoideocrella luteorostrata]